MWKWIDVGGFVTGTQGYCMTGTVLERELPHSSSFFTSLISHGFLFIGKANPEPEGRNPIDAVGIADPPRPQSCVDRSIDIGSESQTKDVQRTALPHQFLSYKTQFNFFLVRVT